MLRSVFSSFRARLVLLVFLALLPALALILYRDFEERDLAREEVQTTALRLAELAVTDQGRVATETRDLLDRLVQLREVRERDATVCSPLVADLLRRHPRYANLGAIAADGTLFCSALPGGPTPISSIRSW